MKMRSKDIDRLGEAINSGDCSEIDAMIREGRLTAAYTTKSDKWNMLHMELVTITEPHKLKLVRHLIKIGVDVSAKDASGWTPLHFAVRGGKPSVVKALLDAGADYSAVDSDGYSPLYRCMLQKPWNFKIANLLLEAGASPDQRSKRGVTPLERASTVARPDRPKMIALLQEYQSVTPKRKA